MASPLRTGYRGGPFGLALSNRGGFEAVAGTVYRSAASGMVTSTKV
jgi:hypothetical protein